MKKDNLHTFPLCTFTLLLISSKICRGADYQYEACAPTSCGSGPNISFPFFLQSSQPDYCGYPGFEINCKNGSPLLRLSENEYIIEDIFYQNRSVLVFDASSNEFSNCSNRVVIKNTTLPLGRFNYVGGENLYLLFNCKNVSTELRRYEIGCNSSRDADLAMYGGNRNFGRVLSTCEENVVARVGLYGDGREDEAVDVAAVLRKGFVMNWTASDCSDCKESGGHCGFNETSFHFRCFCPDRPHSRSCKPRSVLVH